MGQFCKRACIQSCLHVQVNRICNKYNPIQVPFASYDALDGDQDPMAGHYDVHGTKCAGIVSAAKNNDTCGVGIAYNSNLAG